MVSGSEREVRQANDLAALDEGEVLGVVNWRGVLGRRRPRRHGLRDVAASPALVASTD